MGTAERSMKSPSSAERSPHESSVAAGHRKDSDVLPRLLCGLRQQQIGTRSNLLPAGCIMRGLAAANKELIATVNQILQEDHPQTLRQLHYQIFSRGGIDYQNDVRSYRRLSRVLTKARRVYRQWELYGNGDPPEDSVRADWIVDELRQPETVSVWTDAAEYIETVREAYRRDNWQDQPYHVELWGEKATVLGSMRPIMRKYGITLRVCRGFGSAGMEDQVGRLFEDIDKRIMVFYIGDHDASGDLIGEDMHRRVEIASGVSFEMNRLAIHRHDIKTFNLPPQRIKDTDVRAKRFREKFGRNAKTVELEALPVAELKRRVENAIKGLIDFDLWNRQVMVQKVELASIADFAERMKAITSGRGQGPEAGL